MVNHTILQGVKSILQGDKSMPPARFCAAGPALINRKRHKTPLPFPQPKQECKPRFICHKALNFPSIIFQANFSTPTPGQHARSAPHLLQPVLSQRLKRTKILPSTFSTLSLHCYLMRNENPAQHPSTLPQRGGGRLVATPFAGPSFLFSFSLPRVAFSALRLLSFSARAVLRNSTFAPHLLQPISTPKPHQKPEIRPVPSTVHLYSNARRETSTLPSTFSTPSKPCRLTRNEKSA